MTFLVVGESIADLIGSPEDWRFTAVPGGSPLNVAVTLAGLGQPTRYVSETGEDMFGALLRDHLTRHGVRTDELRNTQATNLAIARIGGDGSATYDFRFGWRLAGSVPLSGVTCLHTGSLATLVGQGAEEVRRLMRSAVTAGVPVSYDPNIRPALLGPRSNALPLVEECTRLARLVKVSADDLGWLYPGEPDLDAARRWSRLPGERLVVVTRGGDGAIAISGDHVITCAAPAVQVADTVGAGDTFAAAFLAVAGAALTSPALAPKQIAHALRRAIAAAAVVCTRRGAAPPTPAEIDAMLPHVPEAA
ncbi:carbohydrate kinase [Nonomuraea rosea]|uniref:Carbohydrate kinase n=1 Tax=Nonomuraea rosea TaxID=638574 RepID=A0ABP6ZDE3_9ACTN